MSYDHAMLLQNIFVQLGQNPRVSVASVARHLGISPRTLQQVVIQFTGKTFSSLREEVLLGQVCDLFATRPTLAIKEVSFAVGFRSPRSFARAVRRACGISPAELRSSLHRPRSAGIFGRSEDPAGPRYS